MLFRGKHIDLHDRFHQLRTGLRHALTISCPGSQFVGNGRRVNRVETTINQRYFHVKQWVTGQWTSVHTHLETLFYSRPEFTRDVSASHLRFKFKSGTCFRGLNNVIDLRKLSSTTRLLLVGVAIFQFLRDRFTISHLWRAYVNFYAVGPLEDIDLDIQVQFTHAFHDGFTGFFICLNSE